MANIFDVQVSFDDPRDIAKVIKDPADLLRLGGVVKTRTIVSAANVTAPQGQARAFFAQYFGLVGTMTVLAAVDLGPTPPGVGTNAK